MSEELSPGKGPMKIFVEGFHCRVVNGVHLVSFGSGEDQFHFVLPLSASKTLSRALSKQIQEIEKQTGKQVPDLGLSDEPVLSPLKLKKKGDK